MAVLEVRDFEKTFGSFKAVKKVSFSLEHGEILAIVGPSGCGKTTTLRCIAGLERPTGGSIHIAGRLVADAEEFVPPEKRDIGMVFQSYALWPHKTVFQNVAYALQIKGKSKDEIATAVAGSLKMVGLTGLEGRYPAELSGGQQQRVALARSVISRPQIILLDEPLSNLDAKLRERMRDDIKELIKSLHISAVHITHDQSEAMGIADRIICMRDGVIEQEGTARELYRTPASMFVADFIGSVTFLDAEIVSGGADGRKLRVTPDFELIAASDRAGAVGDKVKIALRPESAVLTTSPGPGHNVFPAKIVTESFLGSYSDCLVDCRGVRFKVRTTNDLPVGTDVYLEIDPARVSFFAEAEARAGAPAAAALAS